MTHDSHLAQQPSPRITLRGVLVASALWLLYSILIAFPVMQTAEIPYSHAFFGQLVANFFLAVYSIPVWWLIIRGMDGLHWGWILLAHLVAAPVYAAAAIASFLIYVYLLLPPEAYIEIAAAGPWIFLGNLMAYAMQFAMYHVVRSVQRLRWKEQQAMELEALARQQELAALKAQINPHFLFNTLNSISQAITDRPEQARDMIARLGDLLRYALDSFEDGLVTLRDEVRFIRAYLDLETSRFPDRLRVQYEIDDSALDARAPAMILQPLVENAVAHGISPSERGGVIKIEIGREKGRVDVMVADTGVGPQPTMEEGIGLKNTNRRLITTFGEEAALHTSANGQSGFKVSFSIPLAKEPNT